ncbi:hypothetical protein WICMUC_004457 [Wickerhamomyces mucosus]|uniref:BHLH domain-containing protein n=1 Tax=Wickerhamomyces mucosus TaxID=1378264 RepID=A0A9P8PHG5_9ASCO|nr:hypothetical protein WICMUC_004457 [Wickerhamomyces mucosus]
MKLRIPSPPDLKPTIIQMQSSNGNDLKEQDGKRKRRRSSSSLSNSTPSEIEKRKKEHRTAHSIIEKKRRIRMNREFEALKFIIPAVRNNLLNNGDQPNSNQGEGLYKLTILQSAVDYIKYLHGIILLQNDVITKNKHKDNEEESYDNDKRNDEGENDNNDVNDDFQFNLNFAKVDIKTEDYRNLEIDFNFIELFESIRSQSQISKSSNSSISPSIKNSSTEMTKIKSSTTSEYSTPILGAISSPIFPTDSYPKIPLSIKDDFKFPLNPILRSPNPSPNLSTMISPNLMISHQFNSNIDTNGINFKLPCSALNSIEKLGIIKETNYKDPISTEVVNDDSVTSIKSLLN